MAWFSLKWFLIEGRDADTEAYQRDSVDCAPDVSWVVHLTVISLISLFIASFSYCLCPDWINLRYIHCAVRS